MKKSSGYNELKVRMAEKYTGKCIGCEFWRPEVLHADGLHWSSPCLRAWSFNGEDNSASMAGRLDTNGGFSCGFYKAEQLTEQDTESLEGGDV